MRQFTLLEIWKRQLKIRAGSSNTNISEGLGVNLMTVQMILKEFNQSTDDDKCTKA